MSTIYFFRHGQAGLRDNYDDLSETGRTQARELGKFLVAARRIPFSRVIVGGMRRQQATLHEVRNVYLAAGEDFPEPEIDPGWSEFDLDAVCSELAPQIARDDAEFRRQYGEMLAHTRNANSHLHRQWLPCDSTVVDAWLDARYPFTSESWPAFQDRIRDAFERRLKAGDEGNIAVFTSATPVGLSVSFTLGFDARRALRLAGAQYNTSITTMRIDGGEPFLVNFNGTPHLAALSLQTLR